MHYYTSESVSEGHPDKIADQLSDSVLDECLRTDPESRVACEVFGGNGFVLIGGEITTNAYIEVQAVARSLLNRIGYNHHDTGIDGNSIAVLSSINEQSKDIALGVDNTNRKKMGAGDQGIMYGYACKETSSYMPAPITFAHQMMIRAKEVRHSGLIPYLYPDAKCQITVGYEEHVPKTITSVVFSHQHMADIQHAQLEEDIREKIILPVLEPTGLLDKNVTYYINPTGRFVIGGFQADTGLTGRKIMVDTYGGMTKHGGGAFSGKDPSKVDRTATYMARKIAKTIVAAGIADACEIYLAYAIGVSEPIDIGITHIQNATAPEEKITKAIRKVFDCTPAGMIDSLSLLDSSRIQYAKTAVFGHFGRPEFPWEQVDNKQTQSLLNEIT